MILDNRSTEKFIRKLVSLSSLSSLWLIIRFSHDPSESFINSRKHIMRESLFVLIVNFMIFSQIRDI